MQQTPPTVPGPVPPRPPLRANPIIRSMLIHACCAVLTCFIVPLAMNSNIWPIAGVFWSGLSVPPAAIIGALIGWLTRRMPAPGQTTVQCITALAAAIALGIIIANNR